MLGFGFEVADASMMVALLAMFALRYDVEGQGTVREWSLVSDMMLSMSKERGWRLAEDATLRLGLE
jgi:hypothetical protein